MALSAGTRLGPYEILAPLGAGGMGEVFRARDTRLGRTVAIKVLPRDRMADPERKRRFLLEARVVSALNHPNIVALYDIAQDGGVDFLVMEHVPGQALNRLIPRGGLPARDVIHYALQMSSALAAAHASGIIHRDIKPANMMVTPESNVKILDFGLAKLTEPESSPADAETETEALTGTGVVLGTPGYMSPEQIRGGPVDHRSDIFSLGCVLYQMAGGQAPFSRPGATESLAAILMEKPPPLARSSPPVPPALEQTIFKCLTKNPEERFQSAREVENALREADSRPPSSTSPPQPVSIPAPPLSRRVLIAGGSATLLAAAGVVAWWRRGGPQQFDSLAVLPLANATGDPANDYIAEGVSESVINRLSQTRLKVTARTTAYRMRERALDPVAVGRELKVSAVMTGRVTRQGSNLVVQAELVNAADGTQLWGDRFIRPLGELQAIEADIATRLSESLRLRLTPGESQQLNKHGTANPEAYRLYLLGLQQWNRIAGEGFTRAIEYFNLAIALDPNYAQAYAGLAHAYALLGIGYMRPPKEMMPRAKQAADRALQADEAASEAHVALAMYNLFFEWDWPAAEREFQRAFSLNPNSSDALHFYGHYLEAVGRTAEAITAMERAVALDPLSLVINSEYGCAYYFARRFSEATLILRRTLEVDPGFVLAGVNLAQALERVGQHAEALAELEKVQKSGSIAAQLEIACTQAAGGRADEARRTLADLTKQGGALDPVLVATVYAELHDTDATIRWLEAGYEAKSGQIVWINVEPKFDPVRSDRRFQDLLRRLKLA